MFKNKVIMYQIPKQMFFVSVILQRNHVLDIRKSW